ncbi:Fanconi anemia group J protein [Coemansia sp. Benny D115]|nr:Fanconi anemia group J protein [Coemansia sp. Benny D115]
MTNARQSEGTTSKPKDADTGISAAKSLPHTHRGGIRLADSGNGFQMYYIGGVQVHFPYKPYPSQLAMMNHVIRSVSSSTNAMIESPTGSGKSLALLCAVLAWHRGLSAARKVHVANISQVIFKFLTNGNFAESHLAEPLKPLANGNVDNDKPLKCADQPSTLDADVKPKKEELESCAGDKEATGALQDVKPNFAAGSTAKAANGSADLCQKEVSVKMEDVIKNQSLRAEPLDSDPDSDFETANKPRRTNRPIDRCLSATPNNAKDNGSGSGCGSGSGSGSSSGEKLKAYANDSIYANSGDRGISTMVDMILAAAKLAMPRGLTQADIETLEKFKRSNIGVKPPRIYFGSRTHKQVTQLISELRTKSPYRLKTAVLGSRAQTCINREAQNGLSIDEACVKLTANSQCRPYANAQRLVHKKELQAGGTLEIWDIEDIVKLGRKTQACPYYASRELAEAAELVFCPYNYILDPGVREATGITLEGNIVILDEAHNVENACRDAGSAEITDIQLEKLVMECQYLAKQKVLPDDHEFVGTIAEHIIGWLRNSPTDHDYTDFESIISVWPKEGGESCQDLLGQLLLTPTFTYRLDRTLELFAALIKSVRSKRLIMQGLEMEGSESEEPEFEHLSSGSMLVLSGLLRVLNNLMPGSKFSNDYCIAKIKRTNKANKNYDRDENKKKRRKKSANPSPGANPFIYTLAFWCLNPGVIFSKIESQARSVILTSGTLSPLDSYATELQVNFASKLEALHVIDPSRFVTMVIESGPLNTTLKGVYNNVNMFSFQDDIGESMCSIASCCPDGMLAFVSSYSLLDKLVSRWKTTGVFERIQAQKQVFVEAKGASKEDFDKQLKKYRECLTKDRQPGRPLARGALMIAVYRGNVSEGIDFSDFFCRTVVNIGIPYPAVKDVKVVRKIEYNNQKVREHEQCMFAAPQDVLGKSAPLTGSMWYETQAFRAISQALGRCLRHRNDWGAIIMLESRFALPQNIKKLSKWVHQSTQVYSSFDMAINHLQQFYTERTEEDVHGLDESIGKMNIQDTRLILTDSA